MYYIISIVCLPNVYVFDTKVTEYVTLVKLYILPNVYVFNTKVIVGVRFLSITNWCATHSGVKWKPRNHLMTSDIQYTFEGKYVWKPHGD